MTVFKRYVLLQVPDWALAAIILYALRLWLALPLWGAAALFAVIIIKDFALYPFLRRAYESGERTGAERLIGAMGIVRLPLDPRGYVEVRGELWHAEAPDGSGTIKSGTRVRVLAAEGMTLAVSQESEGGIDHARPLTE